MVKKKWNEREEAKLKQLYQEGLTLPAIAEQLNRTKDSISHRVSLLKETEQLKKRYRKFDINSTYYNSAINELEKFDKAIGRYGELKKTNKGNYDLIKQYDSRNFTDGLTPTTRTGNEQDLTAFGNYIKRKSFLDIVISDLERYLKHLKEDLKDTAFDTKKSRTKGFYKFLAEKYPKKENILQVYMYLSRGKRGRQKKKDAEEVKARLTKKEIVKLVAAIKGNDFISVRDRAVIASLYDAAPRCSEFVAIRVTDAKLEGKYPYFYIPLSKTTPRDSPLLSFSLPYLMEYRKRHEFLNNDDAPFFYSVSTSNYGEALTTSMIALILKRAKRIAKIKKEVSPHILRDSKITHIAQEGKTTPAEANALFGWGRSSGMYNYYSKVTSEELKKRELERLGKLSEEESKEREEERGAFKLKACQRCGTQTTPDQFACSTCGLSLQRDQAQKVLQEESKELRDMRKEMEKMQKAQEEDRKVWQAMILEQNRKTKIALELEKRIKKKH